MRPIVIEVPVIWVPHSGITSTAGVTLQVTRVGRKSETFTLSPTTVKGDYIGFAVPAGLNLKQGRYDGIISGANCQRCIPLRAPCVVA